jgi:hypothetical protein
VASGCFHCSDPGATPGHRLTTFLLADKLFSDLPVSCAFAEQQKETGSRQRAIDSFQYFMFMGPSPGTEIFGPLFPSCALLHAVLLAELFRPVHTMSKSAPSGSPILPTYCLFLSSGEKSMALLQLGGYLWKGTAKVADMQNTQQVTMIVL